MTMEAPSSASNAVTSTERADAGISCHLTFPLRAGHTPRMALNRKLARRNLEPQSRWTEKPRAWTISPAALAGPLRESSRPGCCKSNAHEKQEQPGTERRCNECVALARDCRSQALVGDRFRSRSNALHQPQIVRHRLWCLEEACLQMLWTFAAHNRYCRRDAEPLATESLRCRWGTFRELSANCCGGVQLENIPS
jgi:hypothetical protein